MEQLSQAPIPHAVQASLNLPSRPFWAKALHGNTKAGFLAGSNFALLEQAKVRALGGSSMETHGGFLPAAPHSAKELFAWGAEETKTIARCLKESG